MTKLIACNELEIVSEKTRTRCTKTSKRLWCVNVEIKCNKMESVCYEFVIQGVEVKKKKKTLQTSCVPCCRLTRIDAVCLHRYYFQTFVNLSEINCSQPESERNCLETSCIPLGNLCDHHVFESHHPETEGGARSTSGRVGRQMQTFQ